MGGSIAVSLRVAEKQDSLGVGTGGYAGVLFFVGKRWILSFLLLISQLFFILVRQTLVILTKTNSLQYTVIALRSFGQFGPWDGSAHDSIAGQR